MLITLILIMVSFFRWIPHGSGAVGPEAKYHPQWATSVHRFFSVVSLTVVTCFSLFSLGGRIYLRF